MTTKEGNKRSFQPIKGFEVLERLGGGGMGTVFRARQISLNRIVALKILKKSQIKGPMPLERLRREALVTARMDHPNIVKGIDLGETEHYFYFVMEFVAGRSVKSILDRDSIIPEERSLAIVLELARALCHAHQRGVIHRDIKPGNIIITPAGRAKLADLGLAKGIMDLTVTQEGTTVGTPQYMSPEQACNPSSADVRADIYSLGATFYHMVTGRLPFQGNTVAQVITDVLYGRPIPPEETNPSVSQTVSRCIAKMMAKKPSRRYQTPEDLIEELERVIEARGEPHAKPPAGVGLSWNESQRSAKGRRVAITGAVVLAVVVVVLGVLFWGGLDFGSVGSNGAAGPSPLAAIQQQLAADEILPAEALRRTASLEAGGDPAVSAEIETFRSDLVQRCCLEAGVIFEEQADRLGRIWLSSAPRRREAAIRQSLLGEVERAFGFEATMMPAELQESVDAQLGRSLAAWSGRTDALRAGIEEALERQITAVRREIEAATEVLDFAAAVERVECLESSWSDRAEGALEVALRRSTWWSPALDWVGGIDGVRPDWLFGEAQWNRLSSLLDPAAAAMRQELASAVELAIATYRDTWLHAATAAVGEADLQTLSSGFEALIDASLGKAAALRPKLPAGESARLSAGGTIARELQPLFERRYAELKALEIERVLLEIEAFMSHGAFSESLDLLRQATREVPSTLNQAFIDRWVRWLETQSKIEDWALASLERHRGLEITVTRKGVTYRGALLQVDRAARRLVLTAPGGRPVTIALGEMDDVELLRWAERSFRLRDVDTFLFFFFRGDRERASNLVSRLDDFEDKAFFERRIASSQKLEQEAQQRADDELQNLLSRASSAATQGDRAQLAEILAAIDRGEKTFARGSLWKQKRKEIERLERELQEMTARASFQDRLAAAFSVRVKILGANRIRIVYPFDSLQELEDFRVRGLGFTVDQGCLLFGADAAEKALPNLDDRVGLRVGEGFDRAHPLVLGFEYQALFDGGGPSLLLLSFYGECFGVRSFPDGRYQGQTTAWAGELSAWEDYFAYPDLGVAKPRKGNPIPFGFNRGERYLVEIVWDGTELLLIIDGATVLRRRPAALKQRWCEIKTLRAALFDNLQVEGLFQGG